MKLNHLIKLTFVFTLAFILAGCGFHLRNKQELPPQFNTLFFNPQNPFEPVAYEFKSMLTSMNITLTTDAETAPFSLIFSKSTVSHNNPSLTNNTLATTLKYTQTIRVSIINNKNHKTVSAQTFTTSLSQILNQNQILTASTSAIATRDLPKQLADHIFLWLTTEEVKNAILNSQYPNRHSSSQHR